MFSHKLDLLARICTFAFSQIDLYKKDYLEELSKIEKIESYEKYFKVEFMEDIYVNLNLNNRISNLDEVNLLFKKFYPRKEIMASNDIYGYYMSLLSKLSKSFICHRNGKIAFKYWKSEGGEDFIGPYDGINKIAYWNSLNRIFTTDILVIKYLLDNNMDNERYLEGYYFTLMLEDTQLDKILKKGVAETHVHKNAGINFYISWQNLMDLTGKKESDFEEIKFMNKIVGKEGIQNYVRGAAICRLVIANYLKYCNYDKEKFETHVDKTFKETSDVYKLIMDIYYGKTLIQYEYKFEDIWDEILKHINLNSVDDNPKTEIKKDILNKVFTDESYLKTSMENIFLFKCLKHMDENHEDEYFNKIFIQYIRIKNEVFQNKVQGNLIKGLENFQKYFKRSKQYKKIDKVFTETEYWRLVLENQFQNEHLEKLELRASMEVGSKEFISSKIKKTVKHMLEAYKGILVDKENLNKEKYESFGGRIPKIAQKVPRIGLVFHLLKSPDRQDSDKCWINYSSNEDEIQELHFGEHRKAYLNQIEALNELRESIPGLSDYIIGIDAASSENDTEPWVFAPVYEKARDSSYNKLFYNNIYNERIKNLGFTFHVGEDFRHLLTGLRRIDEVITHFKFHAGDRIGHGIALGVDVKKWVENHRVVILPRIEYLENLLWIWGVYKDGYYDKCFDSTYLEQEIMKHAEKIYQVMDGITIYNLWKAYRNKFKEFKPNESLRGDVDDDYTEEQCSLFCKYGNQNYCMFWNEEKLSHVQHCKCYLERMLEPIQIEVKYHDIEMLKHVQKIMCSKVSRKAIVVETNPSSNVAIGEVYSIFEHYIYNLNKRGLGEEAGIENSIMISINSDDPSVFNTNVSNEFAYIFYSLQEKDYSREEILLWIDKIRQYGMDSSFIEDRELDLCDIDIKIEELNQLIAHLEA